MPKEFKTKESQNGLQLLRRKEHGEEEDHLKDGDTRLKKDLNKMKIKTGR